MPLVSDAELARVLKRHVKAIHVAVTAGRLTQRPDGLFDLDIAVREFNENTHHEKGHNNRSGPDAEPREMTGQPQPITDKSTYVTARAARECYEAKLKKLRYEERARSLTPTADVEAARFTEFRTLREACFQIPSRVAALLAGETDVARCQRLLETEIANVLTAFADGKL